MSASPIRFDDRVAIVTGAGNGLGRSHALGLAARGAKLVVNDRGGALDGSGASASPAAKVAAEIAAQGGVAVADETDITDFEAVTAMAQRAMARWGRIDILVNNAGILRDKSFAKMALDDFRAVIEVHLMGAVHCAKAVWDIMRAQNYGRIVFTTSSSGLYGNFGQANYGAAKTALIGLMNVLHHEGQKNGIRVNILSPTAATRMTEQFLAQADKDLLSPEAVTPGLLYLASEDAPSRMMLCAGAGCFARAELLESAGRFLPEAGRTPEAVAALFAAGADCGELAPLPDAWAQTKKYVAMAKKVLGR
jgi:NAD(P)-dependent dehydrogenase (short-subunit alcohol dehydrogenase family)